MKSSSELSQGAHAYASAFHVMLGAGIADYATCTPILMPLDDYGRPLEYVSDQTGVDYARLRIDYFRPDYHVAASRMISMVLPGHRTKSAFVPNLPSPRLLEVHQGVGSLILGNPPKEDEDFQTTIYKLDPEVTSAFCIPANCFYALEAAPWNKVPFVVSEVVKTEGHNELTNSEIVLEPGQDYVKTPGGDVLVPDDFSEGIFT